MNVISTSWTCQRCGGAFISTPPEDGICGDCRSGQYDGECTCPDPLAPAYMCPDAQTTCPQCGGPVCATCGQRLMLLVPVGAAIELPLDRQEVHDD